MACGRISRSNAKTLKTEKLESEIRGQKSEVRGQAAPDRSINIIAVTQNEKQKLRKQKAESTNSKAETLKS
jgi:hypothetical protein